jgi:hypothetical protein
MDWVTELSKSPQKESEFMKGYISEYNRGYQDGTKQTVEKFVNLLTNNGQRQALPIEDNKGNICDKAYIIPQSHLRQVAKSLGVEIKG